MMEPEVAIVIPVRNGVATLAGTVDATVELFERADLPTEIVIVDDGSTDETPNAIAELTRRHPSALRSVRTAPAGLAAARNTGIAATTAPMVGFLDADDRFEEAMPAELVPRLRRREADMLQGRIRDRWVGRGIGATYEGVQVGSVIVRRDVFDRIGVFDETLTWGEDYDLLLRAFDLRVSKRRVPDVVLEYLRHPFGMTAGSGLPPAAMLAAQRNSLRRRRRGLASPPVGFPSLSEYLGVPPPDVHRPPREAAMQ